jgi:AhpD family alkylhydroperoxidase
MTPMAKYYPGRNTRLREMMERLGKELPRPMAAFNHLNQVTSAEGALSSKMKELIALAIGITVRCDGCIAFHVHDALEAGATRQEILETIGVAIVMGGGPSMVYGTEALEALNQFMSRRAA